MTALQTVNLGTAPDGTDGDPSRTAFTKVNSNVAVLQSQSALTSAVATVTAAQALTSALHVGKRVNINLASTGAINLPAASTCAADQVTLLRNVGATVVTLAITTGSGDTIALSRLNPGECALMDTDGVHAWNVLLRGRTNNDNETVNGNLSIGGAAYVSTAFFGTNGQASISSAGAYTGTTATYSGSVTVGGALTASDTTLAQQVGAQRILSWAVGSNKRWAFLTSGEAETGGNAGTNFLLARYSDAGVFLDAPITLARSTGAIVLSQRPMFGANSPWDSGNLVGPVTLAGAQVLTGTKTLPSPVLTGTTTVGNATNTTKMIVQGYGTGYGVGAQFSSTVDAGAVAISFTNFAGTAIGNIITSGSSTAFNTTSDYRLKSDLKPIEDALESLLRLKFYNGVYTSHPDDRVDFAIAHELQAEIPYAVTGEKDAMGDWFPVYREGYDPLNVQPGDVVSVYQTISPQGVDYSKLVPRLGAALQEVAIDARALRSEVSALTARLAAIELAK
ncbi:MAG: tail fiber domain-containing protein [Rudaea sp.]|nr:tail fiber domain-containing protein [Rudaea sp.]